mmetsp:Transcript_52674/g.163459  ORF Transcript_52674/g.163459 Transcript_52674/m.163459 type:complete len:496 (+) Transcript_52674:342-1829(+)
MTVFTIGIPSTFSLLLRSLRGGECPRHLESSLEELRVIPQPDRRHIQAEEVPVHSLAYHGALVELRVLVSSLHQFLHSLHIRARLVHHGVHESSGFDGKRANCLCSTLSEEPSYACLVCKGSFAGIPAVSELHGQLEERVRRDVLLLDEALPPSVLSHDHQIQVIAELLVGYVCLVDHLVELSIYPPLEPLRLCEVNLLVLAVFKPLAVTVIAIEAALVPFLCGYPFPHVPDCESIGVAVLCHHSGFAIGKDDECNRLVKPQRFAITMDQHLRLIGQISGGSIFEMNVHESFLDSFQGKLVDAIPEKLLSGFCPPSSVPPSQSSNCILTFRRRGGIRVHDDPIHLLLQLMGQSSPPLAVGALHLHGQLVPHSLAGHCAVSLRIVIVMNDMVAFFAWDSRGVKNSLVLFHAPRNGLLEPDWVQLFPVNQKLELVCRVQQSSCACRLQMRRCKSYSVQDVIIRVDHNRRPSTEVNILLPPFPKPRHREHCSNLQEKL